MNPAWRIEVMVRDGGCVAARIDPDAGPCHDAMGYLIGGPLDRIDADDLEADYIRHGAKGGRHELASDHVCICPGHHRGTGPQAGSVWATSHRPELRAYLESMYGAVV